jgi:hypothetical protein
VSCYACIVYQVRQQKLKSLASASSTKEVKSADASAGSKRPRSLSSPAVHGIQPQQLSRQIQAISQIQIRIEEADPASSLQPPSANGQDYSQWQEEAAAAAAGTESLAFQLRRPPVTCQMHLTIPNEPTIKRRRSSDASSVYSNDDSTWTSEDDSDLDNFHLQVPLQYQPHQQRLQRSASAGNAPQLGLSRTSSICSRIEFHDEDGNVSVFNRRRLPSLLRGQIPRGAVCIRDAYARVQGKRRSEAMMAKRSSYIVLLFLVMWMPLPILVGFTSHHVNEEEDPYRIQMYLDLHVCAFCFGALSTAANPIIYGLAIRSFRNAFMRLAHKFRRKLANKFRM